MLKLSKTKDTHLKKAVVLISGGLDSATCLAIAKAEGYQCYGLSFVYGQRHQVEIKAARALAQQLTIAQHKVIQLDMSYMEGSALINRAIQMPEQPSVGIPVTYVPARNTVFLAIALGWAEVLRAEAIYIGVNAVDYSGYPDCRPEFIQAFQQLANLATKTTVEGQTIAIKTPLIHLSKAEIIRRGITLGVNYTDTISCYQADNEGKACGSCDSCRLRRQGFIEAGLSDPTLYRPNT